MVSMDRILRRRAVEERVGLGRSTIYALMSQGRFPRPIKLGQRAVGWRETEICNWLLSRPFSGGGS